MEKNKKTINKKIVFYVLLTLLAIIWLIPIFTVFLTSIKSTQDFYTGVGLFELPKQFQWSNFTDAWNI